jgi:CspA family cold shock protein
LNARAKRLFEESKKKNPDLKMPSEAAPSAELSDEDLALIKQGVGDKTSRSGGGQGSGEGGSGDGPREQIGSVVTYFEAKGFGFLRPDDGGRDVFFHVSRLAEGDPTTLKPGTRLHYELGMDRTGKLAASSVRIASPVAAAEPTAT